MVCSFASGLRLAVAAAIIGPLSHATRRRRDANFDGRFRAGRLGYDRRVQRLSISHVALLRFAGFITYACVGVPLIQRDWMLNSLSEGRNPVHVARALHAQNHTDILLWAASYAVFGVVYWLLTRNLDSRRYWSVKLLGLLVLTCSALAISWFSASGVGALLLMVVGMVLPWLLPLPAALGWLVLQNVGCIAVFATWAFPRFTLGGAVLQAGLYFGNSVIVFIASEVVRQQANAREEQRRLNSELRATRALLAESSRLSERMRIARELHDLVGHHLTALSLNLEVAGHLVVNEAASDHVTRARNTAKQLLADVREVVSELRDDEGIQLTDALRDLTEGVPGLEVHLELPPRFAVGDSRRAQVLLRCTQEIITNAVRHARARNLWLRFEEGEGGKLVLKASDDGRGAIEFKPGNGLNGMRERLAEVGGKLDIETQRNQGFILEASLPMESTI
ncbi:MAG: sensor histidine kinase [Xanthomonadaceae bacterium]|nr:sensor histidine kinase [Xanthomonadaceae bacterium]